MFGSSCTHVLHTEQISRAHLCLPSTQLAWILVNIASPLHMRLALGTNAHAKCVSDGTHSLLVECLALWGERE